MSLGDTESIVSYNQPGEMYCGLFLGKFDFLLNYSSDSSYIGFLSQSLRIFYSYWNTHKDFWLLKTIQALNFLGVNPVFVSLLGWMLILSPVGFLDASRLKSYSQVLPQKIFEMFSFSSVSQAVPNEVLRHCV